MNSRRHLALWASLLAVLVVHQLPSPEARADTPPKQPELAPGAVLRLGSADFHHGERVDGLVVLDGGKRIATLSERYLIVWDVATGGVVSSCELPALPEGPIRANSPHPAEGGLAVLADGSAIIAHRDKVVTLHKLPIDKNPPLELPPPPAKDDNVVAVAPSGKGATLLAVTAKGAMLEWKVGNPNWTPLESPLRATVLNVNLSIASGGGVSAILDEGDRVQLWDTSKGKSLGAPDLKRDHVLAISADGKQLLAVNPGLKGGADVRSLPDWKSVASWKAPQLARTAAFSGDSSLAAIGYSTTSVRGKGKNCVDVSEIATGKRLHSLPVPGGAHRVAFLPSGDLVSVDLAGCIQIWDTKTGQARHQVVGHSRDLRQVIRLPGGGWVTAGGDGVAIAWSAGGKEVQRFEGHSGAVTGLALSNDGKALYTAGWDNTVREWNTSTGKERRKCIIPEREALQIITSLALSPTGKWLAAGSYFGEIRLLETEGLTVERTLKPKAAPSLRISKVDFVSDELLLSQSTQQTIHFWDVGGKGELRQVAPDQGWATKSARFILNPDRTTVALPIAIEEFKPSLDGRAPLTEIGFWDVEAGKFQGRIKTETKASITVIAYLPGGKAIAVGDSAGTVRVIELEKKEPRHVFKGHRGPVLSLAASPDGKTLASGGADTTVLVWSLEKP